MIGLPCGEKNYDNMLSRFHLIPERYGQTYLLYLEWRGYPMVKKLWGYVWPFRQNTGVCQTDGQTGTDGQVDILPRHSPRYAYTSRSKSLCIRIAPRSSRLLHDNGMHTGTWYARSACPRSHLLWLDRGDYRPAMTSSGKHYVIARNAMQQQQQ